MKRINWLVPVMLLATRCLASAASPGDAPQLPITGTRIVNVATEAQLQTAMGNLQNGDTLLLANGTYTLTSSLYVNGRHSITIRGTNGSANVVLVGKGNHGVVEHCVFEYTGSPPNDHGAGAGYFNGISAHAAQNWIVRGNLFRNLHNPDTADYLWNPAVLFWRHSAGTITEQNTFINVDRAIAYGLDNSTPYFDHSGGAVRNNFVYLTPGLMSAGRKAGSDGSIIAWNSPGTQIDHNTVLLNSNEFYAVQFRFPTTTNGTARNNLSDAPIHLRDSATATLSGNLVNASSAMFVNPAAADLHLLWTATNAIDKAPALVTVTNDFDAERRPRGASADIGADEFFTNAPPLITSFALSGSNCLINFTTLLGLSYDVQRAADLTTNTWSIVASNFSGTGGVVQSTDTNAAGQSRRFYRIRLSP